MEHIVLSLLLLKNMTIYELRTFISQNLTSICSDSLGSIQAAIKKLLHNNEISYREFTEKGLNKKEYSITEVGLEKFMKWIEVPMNFQKVKNIEESKFFFLGMAPVETRIQALRSYIENLKLEQQKLIQIQTFIEATKENVIGSNVERISMDENLHKHLLKVTGEEKLELVILNIYRYQIYCLEYGLERVQYDIDYYQKVLKLEEKEGLR